MLLQKEHSDAGPVICFVFRYLELCVQLADLLQTADQGTPLLGCKSAQNLRVELIDEPEHIIPHGGAFLRGDDAHTAAVIGVHHAVNEPPLLHPVQNAGNGRVLQMQDLGNLFGRAGASLPQAAEHTILARRNVELRQTSGKGLEYLMLRRSQKIVDTTLQFHVMNHLCFISFLNRTASPAEERLPHLPEPFFLPGPPLKYLDSKALYHTNI